MAPSAFVQARSILMLCAIISILWLPRTGSSTEHEHSRSVPQWTVRVAEVLDEQRWRVHVIANDGDAASALPTPDQVILTRSSSDQELGAVGSLFSLAVEIRDASHEPPIYAIVGLPRPMAPPASDGPEPTVSDEAAFRAELVRRMTLSREDVTPTAPLIETQTPTLSDPEEPQPIVDLAQPAIIFAVVLGGRDQQLVEYVGPLRRGRAWQGTDPSANDELSVLHRDGRFALIQGLGARPGDMVQLRQIVAEGQP